MNQTSEQVARDHIDRQLLACGWLVQNKPVMNLAAGRGVAVRELQTEAGPADYILFVDRKPVGLIEAKRVEEGMHLTTHEVQTAGYATSKLRHLNNAPLSFAYESTGAVTRFTDYRDPKPRSRTVFTFHRPETFAGWLREDKTLRARFSNFPELSPEGLRDCQIQAVTNLESSFRQFKPKALVQMATGSGKTFTAITSIYRLLKFARARRILFLVDTKNLGEQAEQEFRKFLPQDDNRLFPELYGVTRLASSFIPGDSQVYISTIQRLYSILKGVDLHEKDEEENPNEASFGRREPLPVVYNARVPMEFFDFVVIDECHRSIYNLWKQVLDYFDAFQVGLTATPDNRTFGYFHQNLVCDYGYLKAVEDGVLVPYNVFEIETKITTQGASIAMGESVGKRERQTRREFWSTADEDMQYSGTQLDRDVVNPNQLRLVIQAVRDNLPLMFPDRYEAGPGGERVFEVPKTLIFAKSDSHADDIIRMVRDEFAEGNDFCRKITYNAENPKTELRNFRNEYHPRIAVTVDMIATGTDIRPLEVLVFLRDIKSRSYYEQMKGRGTRTCSLDELRKSGTPAAKLTKDHFVIIDAVGVEKSRKTDSRPLEKRPGVSLKEVLERIHLGDTSEEMLSTLANRLIRLDRQISDAEKATFARKAGGRSINQVVRQLLNAYDPDVIEAGQALIRQAHPGIAPQELESLLQASQSQLVEQATEAFNDPDLRNYIIDVRKKYDQIIDTVNPDEIVRIGWVKDSQAAAATLVQDFKTWIEENRNEITALQLFYDQPYRRREISYSMIKSLAETLRTQKPMLAPLQVWKAYEQLEKATGQPKNELIALVSLVRRVSGADSALTSFDKTVDKNFQDWTFRKQAGATKYTEEQMHWLRMIKDYIANSFHVDRDDFELDPFNKQGGLGRMWQLFGRETDRILEEMNEGLVA